MTNTVLTPLQRTVSPETLADITRNAHDRCKCAGDEIYALLAVLDLRAQRGGCGWCTVLRMRGAFRASMLELDRVITNPYLDGVFRAGVRRYRDAVGAYYNALDDRRPTPEHIPAYDRCADTLCGCRGCARTYYTEALIALNALLY